MKKLAYACLTWESVAAECTVGLSTTPSPRQGGEEPALPGADGFQPAVSTHPHPQPLSPNLNSPPILTWALTKHLTASGRVAFSSFLLALGPHLPLGHTSAS